MECLEDAVQNEDLSLFVMDLQLIKENTVNKLYQGLN